MKELAEASNKALNSETVRFLQESLELFDYLTFILEYTNNTITNNNKLKKASSEYRWLNSIRILVEKHKHEPEFLLNALQTEINEFAVPHIQTIAKYNRDFAEALLKHKISGKKDSDAVKLIMQLASNINTLIVNIDVLLENAHFLEEVEKQDAIKKRAVLIIRLLEEIKTIGICIADLEGWTRYINEDISFFGRRVLLYIEGGIGKDNKQFPGLEKFKDNVLIASINSNPDIVALLQQTNVVAQIRYIRSLIAFLERDIDIKQQIWLRNISTKVFYKNIEKHASAFLKSFGNQRFAELMLQNKEKLGEEPFSWIELLNGFLFELRPLIKEKNDIIENARKSLIIIFQNRQLSLRASIEILAGQISQILKAIGIDTDLIKKINKGIKATEKILNRLWLERLAKFLKIKGRIEMISFNVKPEISRLLEVIDIRDDVNKIMTRTKTFIDFSNHKQELMKRVRKFSSQYIPHLLMLNFDLARMEEIAKEVQLVQNLAVERTNSIEKYDSSKLREAANTLVQLYKILIQWLIYIGIRIENVDLKNTYEAINKFKEGHFVVSKNPQQNYVPINN